MKHMPKVEKFMTTMPHSIGTDIPMETARKMMQDHGFRHLPVEKAGKLVGVLTDRDIKFASSFGWSEKFRVEDVMTPEPYTVRPEAPLSEVVATMAEHKYGCAVVQQQNGKVVGIFTTTDALRVFGEILPQHYSA